MTDECYCITNIQALRAPVSKHRLGHNIEIKAVLVCIIVDLKKKKKKGVKLAVLLWHFLLSNQIFCGSANICSSRLQRGKKHQIENGSGAEDNGDSSHCSNASVHSNQEAGPSIKRTKTSDDSGLDMDNTTENGAGDTALDGASEIELVFRPHPTLMEKEDAAQTRWLNTEKLVSLELFAFYFLFQSTWNNTTVSTTNFHFNSHKEVMARSFWTWESSKVKWNYLVFVNLRQNRDVGVPI